MPSVSTVTDQRSAMCTKENAAFVVSTIALITFVVMNVLGVCHILHDPLIISSANISLSGLAFAVLATNLSEKESKAKQIAKIVALLAPLFIINALSIGGIAPFSSAHILGWSNLGIASAMIAMGYCILPSRKFTPEETDQLNYFRGMAINYHGWPELRKERIERVFKLFADLKIGFTTAEGITGQEYLVFKYAFRLMTREANYSDLKWNYNKYLEELKRFDAHSTQSPLEFMWNVLRKRPHIFPDP